MVEADVFAPGERHGAGRRVDGDHAGADPQTGVEASGQPAPDLSDTAAGGKGEGDVGAPPPGGPRAAPAKAARISPASVGATRSATQEEAICSGVIAHTFELFGPPAGEQEVVHTRLGVSGGRWWRCCWKGQGTHRSRKRM